MHFLERLREALDRSYMQDSAREALLLTLAIENANPACRWVLLTLPKTATLVEMMEDCSRVGSTEEQAQQMAAAYVAMSSNNTAQLASAFAAATKPLIKQGKGDRGPVVWYNCGKRNHIKAQCRAPKKQDNSRKPDTGQQSFNGVCKHCDKFGHRVAECRSCFKKDGTVLGNRMTSARNLGAQTHNAGSTAAWMASPLLPQGVPESMSTQPPNYYNNYCNVDSHNAHWTIRTRFKCPFIRQFLNNHQRHICLARCN